MSTPPTDVELDLTPKPAERFTDRQKKLAYPKRDPNWKSLNEKYNELDKQDYERLQNVDKTNIDNLRDVLEMDRFNKLTHAGRESALGQLNMFYNTNAKFGMMNPRNAMVGPDKAWTPISAKEKDKMNQDKKRDIIVKIVSDNKRQRDFYKLNQRALYSKLRERKYIRRRIRRRVRVKCSDKVKALEAKLARLDRKLNRRPKKKAKKAKKSKKRSKK